LGKPLESLADYNTVIKLDGSNYDAYFSRGSVNLHTGNFAEAVQDFTEAIRIDHDGVDAYFARAESLKQLADITDDFKEAAGYLEKAQEDEATADRLEGEE
jgi:tetratricopeptide (TPR) repeat protein